MSDFVPLVFPEWIVWGQRRGAFLDSPKGLCRWCREPLTGRRTCWCSDAHAKMFIRVSTWADVRSYVIARDRICQRCGVDHPGWKQDTSVVEAVVVIAGFVGRKRKPSYRVESSRLQAAWEVDHIVPVRKGGTDNPENLRLLCAKCHIAVGYEQRAA